MPFPFCQISNIKKMRQFTNTRFIRLILIVEELYPNSILNIWTPKPNEFQPAIMQHYLHQILTTRISPVLSHHQSLSSIAPGILRVRRNVQSRQKYYSSRHTLKSIMWIRHQQFADLHTNPCHPGITRLVHFIRIRNHHYSIDEMKIVCTKCPD